LSWLRWCPALPLLTVGLILATGDLLRDVRWVEPQGEPITVALLQGNIPQDMKWRPEKFSDSLRTYYRLAQENPAQLTVLPETALPAFFDQVPRGYLDELKKLAMRQQGDLLFGIALGDVESGGKRYANGAVSIGTSEQQQYSKSHLVPFGEFVPPGFAWFLSMANIPMSDFTPGALKQAPLSIAGQKVAVNICYEDAFGEEIIRALPEATLLVNLSNVAWFGDSLAPAQHLQIARMRALESGRMMLRATNTGMTAIVGVDGYVQAALPSFTRGALVGEVRGYKGTTPYVRWGNWLVVSLAALLVALFFRRKI
jgi:apolipoprotein N-acyltransferase